MCVLLTVPTPQRLTKHERKLILKRLAAKQKMRGDTRMSAEEWKLWEAAYDSDDDIVEMQKDASKNLVGKGAVTDYDGWQRWNPLE